MGQTVDRSSLKVMLDPLGQTKEKPKVFMPALPVGPVFKGGPLPKMRALPVNFDNGSSGVEEEEEEVIKVEIFGRKTVWNMEEPEESPYSKMPELESYGEPRSEQDKAMDVKKLAYVLTKNSRVWCGLPDAKWELGNIQSVSGDVADVRSSDGKVLEVSTENLLPANPDILDGVDDLIHLSFLNEPSVLHNLQCRYSHNMVYTKAGPVLVALNPFKEVSLYGNDFLTVYRKKLIDMPHVFSKADAAYNELMIDGKNQSIIISGESGSGKTETAKFAMQYLAALGGVSGIEDVLLHTNLILDSFGNAKTLINDNSSRFGKLIEIHFSAAGKICGANIQTFLLEKSRVVQIATGERSYHVLYQLCAGAPPHLKEKLNLKEANEYEYLKQSNCLMIDDVDDAQRFNMLMEALDIVKICKEDQENAFAMLATVLWLGNIGFSVIDNENHVEVDLSEGITTAARLMGCDVSDLMLALSTHKLKEGNENISEKLTLSEAIDTRDALAKAIYASLFDWLVDQLNNSLETGQCCPGRSISILDIYGFESFQRNSFEQLCINYANERLQQHFNRHMFKLVQEEYSQNGIDWTIVDFVDNTECLNLFEKKPIGLLSLLDEESTFPKATDVTFVNKLKKHLSDSFCIKGERVGSFRICHFAGEVLYNSIGFLEKNRDLLHSDSIQLLASCCCRLPQLFASHMHNQLIKPVSPLEELNGADSQKQSVGTKFKDQLFKLMQQLENTTPHFIRCIKPNSQHLPGIFDYDLVLQQLRCCSVVEVVQISRVGYPSRMTHQQFAERYGFFLLGNEASQDSLSVSVNILQHLNVLPEMYQVGYMKIFFRTGQMAALEEVRHRTLQGILCVQKHFRGWLGRKNIKNLNCSNKSKDSKKDQPQVPHTVLEEFQEQALKAEAALRLTQEENLTLKKQIQQYETRWSENEAKVKSMEEMWQKQLTSLQTSLAEAKRNLAADDRGSQPPRNDTSQHNHNLDTEDTTKNEVSNMVKEFEQQKQAFEDEAKLLTEEKSGQSLADMKPAEELQKLKGRFAAWKKDYKVKLWKTKVSLGKLGDADAVKPRKRWWDIRRKKWWDIRRKK